MELQRRVFIYSLCFVSCIILASISFKNDSNVTFMPFAYKGINVSLGSLSTPLHYTYAGGLASISKGISSYDFITDHVGSIKRCENDIFKSRGRFSVLKLLHSDPKTRTVAVFITTFDKFQRPKTYGGDVIVVWAEQEQVGNETDVNRISGTTVDHQNGSYTGWLHIPWTGRTVVRSKIAATLDHTCRRFKAMAKYGNSVFATDTPYGIHYEFTNRHGSELTRCAPFGVIYGYNKICNFTGLNFGLPWFCGAPTTRGLLCSNLHRFGMLPYDKSEIVPRQPRREVIKGPITQTLQDTVEVHFDSNTNSAEPDKQECYYRNPIHSWTDTYPTGFGHGKQWVFVHCKSDRVFDANNTLQCLKGKTIVLLGDSTVRQYLEGLDKMVDGKLHPVIKSFTLVSKSKENINITWRKHEMPFHNIGVRFNPSGIRSVPGQIRRLADDRTISGQDIVLVVHYNSHLQAFPVSVFRERIQHLVVAIKYLQKLKPEAKVLFKGPHLSFDRYKWFDARIALIYHDIVFDEFAEIRNSVIYMDLLSISIAYNNEGLHLKGPALGAQLSQLLTYICSP